MVVDVSCLSDRVVVLQMDNLILIQNQLGLITVDMHVLYGTVYVTVQLSFIEPLYKLCCPDECHYVGLTSHAWLKQLASWDRPHGSALPWQQKCVISKIVWLNNRQTRATGCDITFLWRN